MYSIQRFWLMNSLAILLLLPLSSSTDSISDGCTSTQNGLCISEQSLNDEDSLISSTQDLQQEASMRLLQQLGAFDYSSVTVDKREAVDIVNKSTIVSPVLNKTTECNQPDQCDDSKHADDESIRLLQIEEDASECIFVRSEDGLYRYWHATTIDGVCGLYIIAKPDELIQLEIERMNVSCKGTDSLSVVDGWELNGEFFPGSYDHRLPYDLRYRSLCGQVPPMKTETFVLSQNVGLVQFRIQIPGEGFEIRVRFIPNPAPCNVVFQHPQGVYTLRNHGQQGNCSVSILFPQTITILSASVGVKPNNKISHNENHNDNQTLTIASTSEKCLYKSQDYVQLLGGHGLDTGMMQIARQLCPFNLPDLSKMDIACDNTAVRLVSSGSFENSITIAFDLLPDKPTQNSFACPVMKKDNL